MADRAAEEAEAGAAGAGTAEAFLNMLRANPQVAGLVRIPLMLTLVLQLWEARPGRLPTRRVEIYEGCLRGLMRSWPWTRNRRKAAVAPSALCELLERVGYALFERGYQQFPLALLQKLIAAYQQDPACPPELQGVAVGDIVAELELLGVLVRATDGPTADRLFLHRTFHECFTARRLARLARDEGWASIAELIDEHAVAPAWEPVTVLLAGLLDDPAPLLDLLSGPRDDGFLGHPLARAAQCLPELAPEQRQAQPDRIDRITNDAFGMWRRFRERGIDAAVPDLERVLPVLVQVEGRYKRIPLGRWIAEQLFDLSHMEAAWGAYKAFSTGACQPFLIKALVGKLVDRNWQIRKIAALALMTIGTPAATPEVIIALLARLADPEPLVREIAAEALGKLGPAATPEVIIALLVRLDNESWKVRHAAAEALGQLGPAAATAEVIAALRARLADKDRDMRCAAAEALGQLGPAAATAEVIAALRARLDDEDWSLRKAAAEALGKLGQAAVTPGLLQVLLARLDNEDWSLRKAAAEALGRLGPAAATPQVLEALRARLDDEDGSVCKEAARALGVMGPAAATPEILDTLCTWLDSMSEERGSLAANGLGAMGPAAVTPKVIKTLIARLDGSEGISRAVAEAIKNIGPAMATSNILDAVVARLGSHDSLVKKVFEWDLEVLAVAIATPEILESICAKLHDESWWIRAIAADNFGILGAIAATPTVLRGLCERLADENQHVRRAAINALTKINPTAAPEILPTLLKRLGDQDYHVRCAAARMLGQMSTVAAVMPNALVILSARLADPAGFVRRETAEIFWAMGAASATPVVVQTLRARLDDWDKDVRAAAAEALKVMGHTPLPAFEASP